ncbi:hypothetical protein [Hymenobacter sp. DG01]|uniref:hypothetical protein n=1 Tax=Hymenobacter sp. DG01 TaxID=2584940 RepID=UPI00111DDD7B|nr:hypothetical protein [Hymenobacter sp. DG01]
MFTLSPPFLSPPPVVLPVPVVDALLPLPPKKRVTQLRLMAGGGLALVHRAGQALEEADRNRLLDAWGFADVRVNLLEPLEGIPLVMLAAQVGELPALVSDINLGKGSRSMVEKWLEQASTAMPATLQLVLLEPVADAPGKGRVLCSRALAITDTAFWRPLCRVLREQLPLFDQGDAAILSVAADAILSRSGAAAGVLAGGPVAQQLA